MKYKDWRCLKKSSVKRCKVTTNYLKTTTTTSFSPLLSAFQLCNRSMSDFLDAALSYRLDHTFPVALFSDLQANRNRWATKHHLEMKCLPSSLSTYVCPGDKARHHGNRPPHYSSRIHYGVVWWSSGLFKIWLLFHSKCMNQAFRILCLDCIKSCELAPCNLFIHLFSRAVVYKLCLSVIAGMKWLGNSALYCQPCGKRSI